MVRERLISSFVGRRHELEDIRRALGEARLVTLTGPGGVGKTRLAIESAERMQRVFGDGVWIVPLADLDPNATADSIAATILHVISASDQSSRGPQERLADFLAPRHVLLVLDNCEHLLGQAAELCVELLSAAPRLRVLATSREVFLVGGEQSVHIPPLATPDATRTYAPRDLETFDAVVLLRDRVRQIDPAFGIDEANAGAVAQLCHQLDGLPLAIELAAIRLRSLTISQVVGRLTDRFSLLNSGERTALPRQQSLRAVFDWSYDLCSADARQLWRRIAVFPGSFDIDAAEHVCGFGELSPHAVFESVDRLVAQSIVLTERDATSVRYRLLATVREYAFEKLDETGETEVLRRRHRDYVLDLAREAFYGRAPSTLQHADAITALHWSASADESDAGLELAVLLGWHWVSEGYLDEGRRWLESLLRSRAADDPQRANALWAVIWVALIQDDRDGARAHLEDLARLTADFPALDLQRHLDHWSGLYAAFSDEPDAGARLLRRAVEAHQRAGDPPRECIARFQYAFAVLCTGDFAAALAAATEALSASELHHMWRSRDWAQWTAGVARWGLGDLAHARRDAVELLQTQRESQDYLCAAASAALLGWVTYAEGDSVRAGQLTRLADRVFAGIGTSLHFFGPRIVGYAATGGHVPAVPAQPDPPPAIDELVTAALGDEGARGPHGTDSSSPRLTSREMQVALLIAEGLSNQAIAERLVISRRTAEGHVVRIMRKLDMSSRSAVAAWVASRADAD